MRGSADEKSMQANGCDGRFAILCHYSHRRRSYRFWQWVVVRHRQISLLQGLWLGLLPRSSKQALG